MLSGQQVNNLTLLNDNMTARFKHKTSHLNKVPGSVPEKQRTPISGTQLGTAITFKLLGQMTSNLNHS